MENYHYWECCNVFQDGEYLKICIPPPPPPPSLLLLAVDLCKTVCTSKGIGCISHRQSAALCSRNTEACDTRHTSICTIFFNAQICKKWPATALRITEVCEMRHVYENQHSFYTTTVHMYWGMYVYNLLSACPITLVILPACRIHLQQVLFFFLHELLLFRMCGWLFLWGLFTCSLFHFTCLPLL